MVIFIEKRFIILSFAIILGECAKKEIIFDAGNGELRKVITVYNNSTNYILVHNVPSYASSLLFEAHSHVEDIALSQSEEVCFQCSVTGKNIGMIYTLHSGESEAHMWLLNKNLKNMSVLISISILDFYGPIPGGCNMEFPTEIAPYMRLRSESGKVYLEYQHANIGFFRDEPEPLCSLSLSYIKYDVYVLYLKENDFSEAEYFNKMKSMSNVSMIKKYSNKVMSYSVHPDTRYSFLMYPNVGVVYNVVAKYTTVKGELKETPYVPVASYGCGKSEFTEYGCNFIYVFEAKAFLFLLSMYGFITAYFGDLFFGATIFFFGFLTFCFITLVLTGRFSTLAKSEIMVISGLLGIIGGGIWLFFWLWFQIPVVSLLLVGLVSGFLVTATILYSPVGNYEMILNDRNYWLILVTGSLLVTVVLLAYPIVLTVLGSSFVGSYIMLLYYDDFIGTRLSYIILNIIKRAVSKNLEFAANDYPFRTKDAVICATWVILFCVAIIVQSRNILSTSRTNSCFSKFCFCKTRISERCNSDECNSDCNPRQPLCNNDSVFYDTFPK